MPRKILIVDDEADIRMFLETLLTENGYTAISAADGDTGFDLAKADKPDAITLDIIMPHETGVKFYRRLIKEPSLQDVPVIILSGVTRYKDLFGRDHATMPKPFAFVEKPIDQQELLQLIEKATSPTLSR